MTDNDEEALYDTVYIYTIEESIVMNKGKNKEILCWGKNANSENVLIRINDFNPSFVIVLPKSANEKNFKKYLQFFNQRSPKRVLFSFQYPLYYYHENKDLPTVRVYFKNTDDMRFWLYRIKREQKTLNVCEEAIDITTQMLNMIRSSVCSWYNIPKNDKVSKGSTISNCKHEYRTKWKNFKPCTTPPQIPLKYTHLTFDLECQSHNGRGFPQPDRIECFISLCSINIYYENDTKPSENIVLAYGDPYDVPGTKIKRYRDYEDNGELRSGEELLLRKLLKIIKKVDPDIVKGHNILGFDLPFIHERCLIYDIEYGKLGRLRNLDSYFFKQREWSSSGAGFKSIKYITMPGRIYMDTLHLIMADFKYKSYKLDFVAEQILGEHKLDVTPDQIFKYTARHHKDMTEEKGRKLFTKLTDYAGKDSDLCNRISLKLNSRIVLFEMSALFKLNPFMVYTRGQQIRLVNKLHEVCYYNDYAMLRREGGDTYKGAFTGTPVKARFKRVGCVDAKSMYPNNMRRENTDYATLVKPKDVKKFRKSDLNSIKTDGGTIHYVKPHIRRGLVIGILEELLDERDKVRAKIKTTNDPMLKVVYDAQQLALKIAANSLYGALGVGKGGKYPFNEAARTVTKVGRKIIKTTNRRCEEEYGGFVIYNDTDSAMFVFVEEAKDEKLNAIVKLEDKFKYVADDLTKHFGHPTAFEFEKAGDFIFYKPKNYVYLMINEKGEYPSKVKGANYTLQGKYGEKLYDYESLLAILRDPVSRPDFRTSINCKNDPLVRREFTEWCAEDVYFEMLMLCFFDHSFETVCMHMYRQFVNCLKGKVSYRKLMQYGRVGEKYKKPKSAKMAVFRERMQDKGIELNPGDRTAYLITKVAGITKKSERMEMLETFDPEEHEIDYIHYIEQAVKPVDKLIRSAFSHEMKEHHIHYRCDNRAKPRWAMKPASLFIYLYKHGKLSLYEKLIRTRSKFVYQYSKHYFKPSMLYPEDE